MSVYVIADPHLSFRAEKPMDVFKGWHNHVERFRQAWLTAVRPEDTVVLPGDISWAMRLEEAAEDLRFLNGLPGTKVLGKGNHDLWWQTMRKLEAFAAAEELTTLRFLFNNAYLVEGIAVCGTRGWFLDAAGAQDEKIIQREAGRLRLSLEAGRRLGGMPVVFLHYPPIMDGFRCAPLMDVLHEYGVAHCYFGHIHGDRRPQLGGYTAEGIRFSLVSADYLDFAPKKVEIAAP